MLAQKTLGAIDQARPPAFTPQVALNHVGSSTVVPQGIQYFGDFARQCLLVKTS
jgi:hypothetical protein